MRCRQVYCGHERRATGILCGHRPGRRRVHRRRDPRRAAQRGGTLAHARGTRHRPGDGLLRHAGDRLLCADDGDLQTAPDRSGRVDSRNAECRPHSGRHRRGADIRDGGGGRPLAAGHGGRCRGGGGLARRGRGRAPAPPGHSSHHGGCPGCRGHRLHRRQSGCPAGRRRRHGSGRLEVRCRGGDQFRPRRPDERGDRALCALHDHAGSAGHAPPSPPSPS